MRGPRTGPGGVPVATGSRWELRGPSVLLLGLAVAVLVGVAALLLSGSSSSSGPGPAGQIVINLPPSVWGLLFLSPLIAGFAGILIQRVREGGVRPAARLLVLFVVALLLASVFVYVFAGTGGNDSGTVTVSPKGSPPPPPGNGSHNGSGGSGGSGTSATPALSITISPWVLLAIVLGVGGCVGALAAPGVLARVVDRPARSGRGPPATEAREELHAALAEAGSALGRGDDPRATIVRLYVRLLAEIAPRIGEVEVLTAQEIHGRVLAVLGVSAPASAALTRLFEEARYSSHPVGPEDAGRCLAAIEQVERDLARSVAV